MSERQLDKDLDLLRRLDPAEHLKRSRQGYYYEPGWRGEARSESGRLEPTSEESMSKKEPSIHDLRSLPDLAREYGYRTPDTLAQAAKDGRLRAIKPGHDWLSCRQWFEEYQATLSTRGKPRGSRKADGNVGSRKGE